MGKKCRVCGKILQDPRITHCSNECLFANLWNSKSIKGTPIETWEDDKPWI